LLFRRLIYSENELEEVLTFYTHKNKSAGVFLGSRAAARSAREGIPERSGGGGGNQLTAKRPTSEPASSVIVFLLLFH